MLCIFFKNDSIDYNGFSFPEDIEGLSLQETSTTPFASSWMDAKLSKTRARSRLWPPSKSTTTVSNFTTNDLNTSNDVDFKLDEYHETDLESGEVFSL